MDAKLTIKLNKDVIDNAKVYAATQKRSLSRIIETYLNSIITQTKSAADDEIKISAFVKSMSTGVQVPSDIDAKKDYSDYLSEKYK